MFSRAKPNNKIVPDLQKLALYLHLVTPTKVVKITVSWTYDDPRVEVILTHIYAKNIIM